MPHIQIKIEVFQSGGLVSCTRKLAALTNQAQGQSEEACLATATLLTAAATLEALLSEHAYLAKPSTYTKEFSRAGISKKYNLLTGNELATDYPDVSELWEHRIAIVHSEPENPRSRQYGTRINAAGATWALNTIVAFARSLWSTNIPEWFRNDAGL